jgi:cobalt-zinc-cadmium efflux system outer membrane protein
MRGPSDSTSENQAGVQSDGVQLAGFTQPAIFAPEPESFEPLDLAVPTTQAPNLSLEALEQMALDNNPSVAEARARVDAARGKWVQVGLPPNTVLGYSGQQLGSGGEAEQQGLYAGQEVVRGGKLRLNRAVAAQEIQKAEQLLAAQQQRVLTDVRLGYYEVLVAQRRTEVARSLVEIAAEAVKVADALVKAKEASQVDVTRARMEHQTAQLQLKNAQNTYDAAWSRLAAVVGLPDIGPRPLVGKLERDFDDIDQNEALARILASSPEVSAAFADVQRARWSIDRAVAEPISNLDFQAIVQSDNSTGSGNANVQVTMPIAWLNRNQGGIRQARAELMAAELAVGRVELNLKRRLASVFQRYANARNQVEDYSKTDGILDNARTSLQFARTGYRAGEFTYLDLLTAQRTYSQTNLAYIEALGELWAATLEIDGLLLKDSLDTQSPSDSSGAQ